MSKRKLQIFLGIIILTSLSLVKIKEWNKESAQISELESTENSSSLLQSTCVQCHGMLEGMSPYHNEIGCVACHFGNNESSLKDSSHMGMITIPGNFSDADQTCGLCHVQALADIKKSMMTSNSGIISVDRYIFGETDSPDIQTHINDLGYSAADVHLRNLCSHCHLGNEKEEFGPISELSRGGGCNSCHLNYSTEAQLELSLADSIERKFHPSLDLNISDNHCFGCHSRSGRISTNYEGWHETLLSKDSILAGNEFRILEDDRVFRKVKEDIHHQKGLQCIDCHQYEDIMGDGKDHPHQEEAVKISCEDCHFETTPYTVNEEELNFTQRRILKIRAYAHDRLRMLTTKKDTSVLLNSYVNNENEAYLLSKADGQTWLLKKPSESCNRDAGHKEVSCSACHSSWAPQCIGCHTDYDPNAEGYDLFSKAYVDGSWIEYAAEFLADEPGLGVRKNEDGRAVQAAIPGMIMTLDQSAFPGKEQEKSNFHRLFAPAVPHTTDAKGRNCKSCHTNSTALGYGRGNLVFNYKGDKPQWEFESEYEDLEDGLPADPWIGFLEAPDAPMYSTRKDFKPFSLQEQQKILAVGACLSCHKEDSEVMLNSLSIPFSEYKKKMSSECVEAVF
jgi:hypothetical protein